MKSQKPYSYIYIYIYIYCCGVFFLLADCRRLKCLCVDVSEHCSIFMGHVNVPKRRHINNSDAGESPKRKNATLTRRRKFEFKNAVLSVHEVRCKMLVASGSGTSALRAVQMSTVAQLSWPIFVVAFVDFFRRILVRVYRSRIPIVRHCRDKDGASVSVLKPSSHSQYLHLLLTQCHSRIGVNIEDVIRKRSKNTGCFKKNDSISNNYI